MTMTIITKSTGERVPFSEKKLRASLARTGAKQAMIDHITANVVRQLRSGMPSSELYKLVVRELRKEARHIAHRYHLRDGLLKLGPAGFKFEQYVASILNATGYRAHVPKDELRGRCVRHEIDVVAEKDGRHVAIEAKFRNKFDDDVDLKDTMATYARYLDLLDGAKDGKCQKFSELWIVTNGRFSDRAAAFGTCRGIRLIGWHGAKESLAAMVDHAALYPITVVDTLRSWELDNLAKHDLLLCRQIAKADPRSLAKRTGMEPARAAKVIGTCQLIVDG
jgi:Holliday junction resolvase-like predicted endonuclease